MFPFVVFAMLRYRRRSHGSLQRHSRTGIGWGDTWRSCDRRRTHTGCCCRRLVLFLSGSYFQPVEGRIGKKAFKQKGMEGIVLVVPQASTEKQVFAFPPKDLGDSFQAIFVGVNPDDTTRGLVAIVKKDLFELQTTWLRKYNSVAQTCHHDADEVATWRPTEVSRAIEKCFQEQPAPDEGAHDLG